MKLSLTLTALALTAITNPAWADSGQCLRQASNDQLMNELSVRLRINPPASNEGSFTASATCAGNAEVVFEVISLQDGSAKHVNVSTGNWTTCQNTAGKINQKIGNINLSTNKIVAVCGGNAEVTKILLSARDAKVISVTATGNWTTCGTTADAINNALVP